MSKNAGFSLWKAECLWVPVVLDIRRAVNLLPSHGLRFADSRFWVTHRRREYGPFDYEWSADFCGIELTYEGKKFGEYCSEDEIFADLKDFKLPMRVVEVGSLVLGCVIYGLLNGLPELERREFLVDRLQALGYGRFIDVKMHGERD